MARKRYAAEAIIGQLREAEGVLAPGEAVAPVARRLGVAEPTYYRGRREDGGLRVDPAKRLKERERANRRRKRVVADQALANAMGRDGAAETSEPGHAAPGDILPHGPGRGVGAAGRPGHRPGAGDTALRAPAVPGCAGADRAQRRAGPPLRPLRLPSHHGPAAPGGLAGEPQAGRAALAAGRLAGPREAPPTGPPLARGRLAGAAAGRAAVPRLVLRLRLRPPRRGAPGADPRPRGCGPPARACVSTSPADCAATTAWRGWPRCSSSAGRRRFGGPPTARRAPPPRCGTGCPGSGARPASSNRAGLGRTAMGNRSTARCAPRAAIASASPPCWKPRSSSRAGGGRTTRSAPTVPSATAPPPRKRSNPGNVP